MGRQSHAPAKGRKLKSLTESDEIKTSMIESLTCGTDDDEDQGTIVERGVHACFADPTPTSSSASICPLETSAPLSEAPESVIDNRRLDRRAGMPEVRRKKKKLDKSKKASKTSKRKKDAIDDLFEGFL